MHALFEHPQHPLTRPRAKFTPKPLKFCKKKIEKIPSYKENGVLPATGDGNIELKILRSTMQAILVTR